MAKHRPPRADVSPQSLENLKSSLHSLFSKKATPKIQKSKSGVELLKKIHETAPSYFYLGEQMAHFPQERRAQPLSVQEYHKSSQFLRGEVIRDALKPGGSVSSHFASMRPDISEFETS